MIDALHVWISLALTFCILSFLYRDNPLYKFAEHVFVGITAGYGIAMAWQETVRPNLIVPLAEGDLLKWIPLGLSLLMFTRFSEKHSWLSRWPLAFVVGMYSGINVVAFGSGDLIIQLQSTMLDVVHGGAGAVSNAILVLGLSSSLLYFYFSREHRGALGVVTRIGVWFLMVSFGASFGYTVMSRISLAIGRSRDLIAHGRVSWMLLVCVAVFLALWARRGGRGASEEDAG
ncbi:MAG: hypothetical protein QF819_03950 [Gemmatimonadota bacterium]|jgi:hypothetical protein|nr:hypothetical protein [Gemmatimonadota bacterium]MDP6802316.1 hypothetical protein [Gemmatimonadota bacterium]MDP7031950.1 hypothetical protein [Gemmatimonadota bacterium]